MSEVKRIATRQGYGEALAELGEEYKNLVVMDADLEEYSKIAIFGLRETFTQLGVDDSFTAKDYAEAVIEANGLDARVISRSNEDYEYFRYNAPADDGTTFRYLVGVYKTDKAFWMVQVTASIVDYEEETFFDYLDSVKFD